MKIIKRGAEAVLYMDKCQDEDCLVKERIKKSYRIDELDESIRRDRTRTEARLLAEAKRSGVLTPTVFSTTDFKILMEFIVGERIKEHLNSDLPEDEIAKIAIEIGKNVGRLHTYGIAHGDLTTSNMILRNNQLFFIDFGLGEFTKRTETLATDLSVLQEAFKSTHFKHLNLLWDNFIRGYQQTNTNHETVLENFKAIKMRGRYKKRGKEE